MKKPLITLSRQRYHIKHWYMLYVKDNRFKAQRYKVVLEMYDGYKKDGGKLTLQQIIGKVK